jgi:hypothetical protein
MVTASGAAVTWSPTHTGALIGQRCPTVELVPAGRLGTLAMWSWGRRGHRQLWGVEEVKPTSVTIRLAVKTRPSKRDDIARQLRATVEGALEQAGIPLPAVAEGLLVAPSPASPR